MKAICVHSYRVLPCSSSRRSGSQRSPTTTGDHPRLPMRTTTGPRRRASASGRGHATTSTTTGRRPRHITVGHPRAISTMTTMGRPRRATAALRRRTMMIGHHPRHPQGVTERHLQGFVNRPVAP